MEKFKDDEQLWDTDTDMKLMILRGNSQKCKIILFSTRNESTMLSWYTHFPLIIRQFVPIDCVNYGSVFSISRSAIDRPLLSHFSICFFYGSKSWCETSEQWESLCSGTILHLLMLYLLCVSGYSFWSTLCVKLESVNPLSRSACFL